MIIDYSCSMNLKTGKIISTIKDQVYDVLKENIVSGILQPGERVQEVQIAEQLQVSRSPVRNAINRLVGEGLLESIPNKCVCVRQFTDREIIESYEFRLIIERYSIEKVLEHMSPEIEKELRRFKKEFLTYSSFDQLKSCLRTDTEFHDYIVTVSGNHVIKEALDKVSMMISPFRTLALSREKRFYESVEEHTGIIDALLDRDEQQAEAYCIRHLTRAKEEILTHLTNQ